MDSGAKEEASSPETVSASSPKSMSLTDGSPATESPEGDGPEGDGPESGGPESAPGIGGATGGIGGSGLGSSRADVMRSPAFNTSSSSSGDIGSLVGGSAMPAADITSWALQADEALDAAFEERGPPHRGPVQAVQGCTVVQGCTGCTYCTG